MEILSPRYIISTISWIIFLALFVDGNGNQTKPKAEYSINDPCNGTLIERPRELEFWSQTFRDCFQNISKSDQNREDELPTILWKTYVCILNSTTAFIHGSITFESYTTFMIQNYPHGFAEKIKNISKNCVKPEEEKLEILKKAKKYVECFYRAEKQMCTGEIVQPKESNGSNSCQPLVEMDRKYDVCCKGEPLPFSIFQFTMRYITSGFRDSDSNPSKEVSECRTTFTEREYELKMLQNNRTTPRFFSMCNMTCGYHPIPYKNMDSLDLSILAKKHQEYSLEKTLSLKLGKTIGDIVEKYKSSFKMTFYEPGVETRLSNAEFVEKFKGMAKELDKIRYYCEYPNYIEPVFVASFLEYCTDPTWVKEAFKNLLEK